LNKVSNFLTSYLNSKMKCLYMLHSINYAIVNSINLAEIPTTKSPSWGFALIYLFIYHKTKVFGDVMTVHRRPSYQLIIPDCILAVQVYMYSIIKHIYRTINLSNILVLPARLCTYVGYIRRLLHSRFCLNDKTGTISDF
jgi:hypothetical protein